VSDPSADDRSLRSSAAAGVKWTSAAALITTALGFAQVAVLARLLSHADFGLMAMIVAVLGLARAYSDVGFSAAIVYRQDATPEQLSSVYWANILASLVVGLIVLIASPVAAAFFNSPQLTGPLRLASVTFVLAPLGQQFLMLMQRDLMFRSLGMIDVVSAVIGLAVAVVLGLAHQGVYALVWAQVAITGVTSLMAAGAGWRRWRPSFRMRPTDLKGFVSFGLYQMGEKTVDYLSSNLDYILIGRFLGSGPLGVYMIAYQLVVAPLNKLNPILTRVAFPVFAKRQHDAKALLRGYYELIELVAFVSFPLLVGLAVTAPVAINVFFGPDWSQSATVVRGLLVMSMLWTISNPIGSLLLAKGRADVGFWWNIFRVMVVFVGLLFFVQYGVVLVAVGHSLISLFLWPFSFWVTRRAVGLEWRDYLPSLRRPLLSCLAMAATTAAILILLRPVVDAQVLLLAVLVVVGAATYIGVWQWRWRGYTRNLRTLLFSRREVDA
jgi:O-antigen/teichoic acid export membrane protein